MYLLLLNGTLKMAKMVNFMLCVFYHNKKKGGEPEGTAQWIQLGNKEPETPKTMGKINPRKLVMFPENTLHEALGMPRKCYLIF